MGTTFPADGAVAAAAASAAPRTGKAKPKLAVIKMTSCDGCQLTILHEEEHLLALTERFEIVEFCEATSSRSTGPFDICLVEGSISTPEQVELILELRRQSKILVALGTCAIAGGIQALRNWGRFEDFQAAVYANPEFIEALDTCTPISEHVKVDAELRGCPIDGGQLVELLTALNIGRRPWLPDESVCMECKRAGNVCVMVTGQNACLGPVTVTGCKALCPSFKRGCFACYGPRENANGSSLVCWLVSAGQQPGDVGRLFAGAAAYAEPFRSLVTELGALSGTTNGPIPSAAIGAPSVRPGARAECIPPASGEQNAKS